MQHQAFCKLSDYEVNDYVVNISQWKHKLEGLRNAEIKIDKDVIDLDTEASTYSSLERRLVTSKAFFHNREKDLKDADKSRSLYSLSKPVKEVTVYPSDFGGTIHENIFKFKEKFLDALESNQVREKGKVELLKKHLRGLARKSIGDDTNVNCIKQAFNILERTYGNTQDIWDSMMKDFERKFNRPDVWEKEATVERRQLVIKIKEFLTKALNYSVEYPALERNIINKNTESAVYGVLPENLRELLIRGTKKLESGTKAYLIKMRDGIDDKFDTSINSYNHRDGVHKAISVLNAYKAKTFNSDTKNNKKTLSR